MPSPEGEFEQHLNDYRDYLRLLVELQVDRRLQGQLDLSGVVQQTLWEACQAERKQPRADPEHLAAWLRKILAHNLTDELRKLKTAKRDRGRERSLEAALAESSLRLQTCLAADQSSPSRRALRQEEAWQLAAALARLPTDQRNALLLRYFHDQSLAEIARQLDRSQVAAAGLLKRGLQQLRKQLVK